MAKLTDICDMLHYNYVYLSRIFKKKFGSTLYNYYITKKMKRAKELIDEGEMPITDVAAALNYSSIYVFSRAFKKTFGISPNEYKHSVNKNKQKEKYLKNKAVGPSV